MVLLRSFKQNCPLSAALVPPVVVERTMAIGILLARQVGSITSGQVGLGLA